MAIQVTCAKCFARFTVSDKFAGQTGPCPKCKTVITIPALNEQVVVHESAKGPKDASGRPVSRPIFRQETPITAIHWTMVGCGAVILLVVAVVGRLMYSTETFPWAGLGLGALLCGAPTAFIGYWLLRDPEAGGFGGQELWLRVAVCAAGFALLWGFSPLMAFAFNEPVAQPSMLSQSVALALIMLAGGGISLLTFDLDYLMGLVHAVTYVAFCLIMRLIAGLPAIAGLGGASGGGSGGGRPTPAEPPVFGQVWGPPVDETIQVASVAWTSGLGPMIDLVGTLVNGLAL